VTNGVQIRYIPDGTDRGIPDTAKTAGIVSGKHIRRYILTANECKISEGRELLLLRVQLLANHRFHYSLKNVSRNRLQHFRAHLTKHFCHQVFHAGFRGF
jgi:hypothetical protein